MTCEEFRRLYKEAGLKTIEARVAIQMGVHGDGCYDCKAWIDQERVRALADKNPSS